MSVVAENPAFGPSPQERAWNTARAETIAVMGTVNTAMVRLVAAVRDLLATDGWVGSGIQSPEHWLCWHANIARPRAEGLVRIARRAGELPECWALFQAGVLGEDAMVRIARRVPAERDMEVAALAPELMISQLDRLLRSLPELPDADPEPKPGPERRLEFRHDCDGWLRGRFCLPPDEGALVQNGLTASRDAEFRDRNDLDPHTEVHPEAPIDPHDPEARARQVTWADGLLRMAAAAIDALDGTLRRTGNPGDRNQVVVHCDLHPDGSLGPGQLEYGPVIPDPLTRYLACDAKVLVAAYAAGKLIGLQPTDRRPNRAMRRYLARRDQGCRHPLCQQRRWLHAHHLVFWENGGLTIPENLVLLCPRHHRALHLGEFSIDGNPEDGTLRFRDRFGRLITPPPTGPPPAGGSPAGGSPGGAPPPGGHRRPSGLPDLEGSPGASPGRAPSGGRPPDGGSPPGGGSPPDGTQGDLPRPGGDQPPGGPDGPPRSLYTPPSAERMPWRDFSWN